MKVIVLNKKTGDRIFKEYPRIDLDVILGLSKEYEIYGILEINKIPVNTDTHKLCFNEEWTDEPFDGIKHIKTYKKTYYSEVLSNNIIIEKLNTSVGEWIDSNYPFWEQNKHTGQILKLEKDSNDWDEYDTARFNWIVDTANWARGCRELRDYKEKELIENNIIPNFIWDNRPDKPEILK